MFSKFSRFAIILVIHLSLAAACTHAAQPLTLDEAIKTALQNNPQLKATQARLGIQEAAIITAGARPNPSIVSDNGIAEKTYRLGIEQTIPLGGKRRKRINLARAQQEVTRAEINTAVIDLRADVRRAYTRLFNLQQRLKSLEDMLATNLQLLSIVQKQEREGDIANLEVQQANISALRIKNDAQDAFGEMVQARNFLNILIGQPLSSQWELVSPNAIGSAPPIAAPDVVPLQGNISLQQADLETLVKEALANRPEAQRTLQEITVTERQLDLARAERLPDVSITAGPDLVVDNDTQLNAFVIANIPIPLFNRQQGLIAEARARRTQLTSQQEAVKNQIILEVTNAYTSFTLSQERIHRYETDLLPAAEKVLTLSKRSFEVGKSDILTPLSAQQVSSQIKLEYLQALMDYQNAISDLERAVGAGL